MFYVPYRFRYQKEFCSPKGPNFLRAPLRSFLVDGTRIEVKLPRHKTRLPVEPILPKSSYALSESQFQNYSSEKDSWGYISIALQGWDFNGPHFTGVKGVVQSSIILVSPRQPRAHTSYFHPRSFEKGIADFLTMAYEENDPRLQGNEQNYLAPVNWRPQKKLPCVATFFEIHKNTWSTRLDPIYQLIFPVSDIHLCVFSIKLIRHQAFIHSTTEPERDTDKWIDRAPMDKLANQILDSVKVTLSPEAKAQQEKALQGLENPELVKDFPPLKWVG